jgi:N-acetylneuraminic acid mutarotase
MDRRSIRWLRALLGAFAFSASAPTHAQAPAWQFVAPPPAGHQYTSMLALGGKLYLLLGYPAYSIDSYDPATNAWTTLRSVAPRAEVPAVQIGGKIYLSGGCVSSDCNATPSALLEIYDPATNSVTTGTAMSATRFGHAAGAINGKLYVAGGSVKCPPCFPLAANTEVYDPSTNAWTPLAPIPTKREFPASAVLGSKLYVMGGFQRSAAYPAPGTPSSVVEAYDPATNTWSTLAPLPYVALGSGAAVINGKIHVVGGSTGTTVLNNHAIYDPDANSWTTSTPMATLRFGHGVAALGNDLYAAAGASSAAGVSATSAERFQVASPLSLQVQPASVDFGGQSMGTRSPVATVTLTNSGTSALSISSITSSNSQFPIAHACTNLSPAASCAVQVAFAPAIAGGALNSTTAVVGSLSISSNAPGSPHAVALSGTAEKSLVTHYYRSILRRAPDSGGKAFWSGEASRVNDLGANLSETWHAMTMLFFTSPEYLSLNRGNTDFVTDLYNTFFNRAPDSGGLAFWSGQLDSGMPREVMLAGFMFSPEFLAFTRAIFGETAVRAEVDTVVDFYRGILGRLPDSGGHDYWVEQFRIAQCQGEGAIRERVDQISALFMGGGEYVGRNRTNSQYVGDLYNAFMRRGGDLMGTLYWISQLATGAQTREQVRRAFVGSPEFGGRVTRVVSQGCGIITQSLSVVAAQGATVTMSDGSSVVIPPGALAGDQQVTIERYLSFPTRIPNPMLGTIDQALGMRANLNPASEADLTFVIKYPATLAARLEGSGAVGAFFDANGTYHLLGLQGGFESASSTATIKVRPTTALAIPRIAVGMLNIVDLAAATQTVEKTLFVPAPGRVRWTGSKWEADASCPPPGKKVLVLVHGMASSVESAYGSCPDAIKAAGKYDVVLGFNYNWTSGIHDSGALLRQQLTTLAACGISQLDLEAHSEGGPVVGSALTYPAGLPSATASLVKNFVAVASPWSGTPIADNARNGASLAYLALSTGLINLPHAPTAIGERLFKALLALPFAQDLQTQSPVLAQIRTGLAALDTNMVFVAGNRHTFTSSPSIRPHWSQMFNGAEDDDIIAVPSARGESINIANRMRLYPYGLAHTQLTCDSDVIRDVGHSLVGACPLSVTPADRNIAAAGESSSFQVSSNEGCPWFASSSQPSWLRLPNGGSGSGTEPVPYVADANTTLGERTAQVAVKFLAAGDPNPPIPDKFFNAKQAAPTSPGANLALYPPSIVVSKVTGTGNNDSPLRSTDSLYIDFSVANTGTSSVPQTAFNVEVFVDGELRRVWLVQPPQSNANSSLLSVTDQAIGSLSAGPHTITIWIDRADLVPESNANDNQFLATITVIESTPACPVSLSPVEATVPPQRTFGAVNVQAQPTCSWQANTTASWVELLDPAGTGDDAFAYFAGENAGASERVATVNVNGAPFTLRQQGFAGGMCSYKACSCSTATSPGSCNIESENTACVVSRPMVALGQVCNPNNTGCPAGTWCQRTRNGTTGDGICMTKADAAQYCQSTM